MHHNPALIQTRNPENEVEENKPTVACKAKNIYICVCARVCGIGLLLQSNHERGDEWWLVQKQVIV